MRPNYIEYKTHSSIDVNQVDRSYFNPQENFTTNPLKALDSSFLFDMFKQVYSET